MTRASNGLVKKQLNLAILLPGEIFGVYEANSKYYDYSV